MVRCSSGAATASYLRYWTKGSEGDWFEPNYQQVGSLSEALTLSYSKNAKLMLYKCQ